jgi:hypothetical protein
MIADKRSLINKALKRIPLLMDRYQNGFDSEGEIIDPEAVKDYDRLIKYLGKGGYEISKIEIVELIKNSEKDEHKTGELVYKYVMGIERERLSTDNPEYESLRDWVVAEKVGIVEELSLSAVKTKIEA